MELDIAVLDAQAQEFLKGIQKRLKSITDKKKEFLGVISTVVFQDIMDHFEQQTGPKGRWKPWSRMYAEHMRKVGKGGNRILQDSGFLRQSFRPTNYRIDQSGLYWFNPARTKSGFPYAKAHDEGGKKLPKRQFMYLSGKALDKIGSIAVQFLGKT